MRSQVEVGGKVHELVGKHMTFKNKEGGRREVEWSKEE